MPVSVTPVLTHVGQLTPVRLCGILAAMQTDIENAISAALALPARVRALLAEKLIESLDSDPATDLSAEWRQEVSRRCREVDEQEVKLRDAKAVFDRAYSDLG